MYHLVTIKGYDYTEFGWLKPDSDKCVQTVGIPVMYGHRMAYVSVLSGLIGCGDIYAFSSRNGSLWRMELKIAYQFAALNLLVLTPRSSDSDWICITPAMNTSRVKIEANSLFYLTPKVKQTTLATNLELRQNGADVKLIVESYEMAYLGSVVRAISYLPENYYHVFRTNLLDENRVYGTAVFDKKQRLVGIVAHIEPEETYALIYVLPSITINCMLEDSCVAKDRSELSSDTPAVFSDMFSETVTKIDGKDLTFAQSSPCIYEETYRDCIPINLYVYLRCRQSRSCCLRITESKREYSIDLPMSRDIPHLTRSVSSLPLTNRSRISPTQHLPYAKLSSLIIMQLTHEFLDLMAQNSIELNNDIVTTYLTTDTHLLTTYLIVVDCDNDEFAHRHDLPQLSKLITGTTDSREMQFPCLLKVDGLRVTKLDDLSTNRVRNISIGTTFGTVRKITLPENAK